MRSGSESANTPKFPPLNGIIIIIIIIITDLYSAFRSEDTEALDERGMQRYKRVR